MYLQVINETRGQVLAGQVLKADNFFSRLKGLLFSPPLEKGQGLLIIPCHSIHCIGMSYPIDAVFFNKKQIVVALVESIKPWQFSAIYWQAHGCLELPAGSIKNNDVSLGDQLIIN